MHFLTYRLDGEVSYGVLGEGGSIIPLKEFLINEAAEIPATLPDFIRMSDDGLIQTIKGKMNIKGIRTIPLKSVQVLAPIPYPQRNIICLGKNYKKHAEEIAKTVVSSESLPSNPIYFSKFASPAIGTGEYILAHENITSQLDYEVELGVVIGMDGKDIGIDEAEKHIFGYTIINDVTARNLQNMHGQWFRGKSLDTFCPMGPYILHKSEVPFPVKLDISSRVNGEVRQSSNTSEMTFDIACLISQLSQGIELKAGDIIVTGTPEGVGMGFKPPRFLKPGDEISCTIEKIGTLTNVVK